jgi:hypothetical protein
VPPGLYATSHETAIPVIGRGPGRRRYRLLALSHFPIGRQSGSNHIVEKPAYITKCLKIGVVGNLLRLAAVELAVACMLRSIGLF